MQAPDPQRHEPVSPWGVGAGTRVPLDGGPPGAPTEASLLHHGGRPGDWGNLGLWGDAPDYWGACAALACAVGRTAGVNPGDRVLSLACGAGEELRLWSRHFRAGRVLGVEFNATRTAAAARALAGWPGVTVRAGSATALDALLLPAQGYDRVLCVDAAYHLRPRSAFLQSAWKLLRPGGTLAYTDLLMEGPRAAWQTLLLRMTARACGVPPDDLLDEAGQLQRLRAAGFVQPRLQRLDDAVLGGFGDFVQAQTLRHGQGTWHPAWRRVALTARLIPACRAAGLGYAMLSATRPAAAHAATPFNAAATA